MMYFACTIAMTDLCETEVLVITLVFLVLDSLLTFCLQICRFTAAFIKYLAGMNREQQVAIVVGLIY